MHQPTLCAAIRGRKLLSLIYDDDIQPRLFAGHVIWRPDTGNTLMSGYNVKVPGVAFQLKNWRNLDIDKIQRITVTDTEFTPHETFNPRTDTYRGRVVCHILEN